MKTLMVVDDDADIRDMLAEVLEAEGYRVICAADGEEALRVLRQGPPYPSLILLDLMMPGMDGWEFRALQAKDPALAGIPVIVLTADGKPAPIDAAGHLTKPVPLQALLDTAKQWTEGSG